MGHPGGPRETRFHPETEVRLGLVSRTSHLERTLIDYPDTQVLKLRISSERRRKSFNRKPKACAFRCYSPNDAHASGLRLNEVLVSWFVECATSKRASEGFVLISREALARASG